MRDYRKPAKPVPGTATYASVRETVEAFSALKLVERRLRGRIAEAEAASRRELKTDPLSIAAACGVTLDPWQIRALTAVEHDTLLLVTRQGGKGEVATMRALSTALTKPGSTILIVSRADRQAKRLLRRIRRRYAQLPNVPAPAHESTIILELENGSEMLAVPGSEETIRGIEAVDLLIIDEASLVPDELFTATFPMLASVDGHCLAMTTPRGKRGWFWEQWDKGGEDWHREKITWREIPRFAPSFMERARRRFGPWRFSQEFDVEFLDDESQFFASELIEAAASADVITFDLPTIAA